MIKSRSLASLMLFSALSVTSPSVAEPVGGEVRAGGATIQQTLGTTTIQQLTDRAIIDWQRFSVSRDELVRFVQPSEMAVILNRVVGQDPSRIMGKLQANGQVFLVNPNGILFGPESRVDVGSLVATTLSISNQDFLDGNYRFTQDPSFDLASVVNQGELRVSDEGYLVLTAPLVSNEGLIVANLGKVRLGAGREMTLNLDGRDLVSFQLGQAPAEGGTVVLTPEAVSNVLGQVVGGGGSASQLVEENGQIKLVGGEGLLVQAGTVQSESGSVELAARQLNVLTTGSMTSAASGSVRLSAPEVTIQADSSVKADGGGGSIVVWADERAEIAGDLTTHGGGFIDTSSGRDLLLLGQVNAGVGGTWLIDPANLTIIHDLGSTTPGVNEILDSAISTALNTGDVVLDAETPDTGSVPNGGFDTTPPQAGNITMNSDAVITKTAGAEATLTLVAGDADGSIDVRGTISSSSDKLNLELLASLTSGSVSVTGSVDTNGGYVSSRGGGAFVADSNPIVTSGGNVLVAHGGDVEIVVDAGAGSVGLTSGGTLNANVTASVASLFSVGNTVANGGDIGTVAAEAEGDIQIDDAGDLTVGSNPQFSAGSTVVAPLEGVTSTSGSAQVTAFGNLSVGQVTAASSASLEATTGEILDLNGTDLNVDSSIVGLFAFAGIGQIDPLEVAAADLTAEVSDGHLNLGNQAPGPVAADLRILGIGNLTYLQNASTLTLEALSTPDGGAFIHNAGDITLVDLEANTEVNITSTGGAILHGDNGLKPNISAESVQLTAATGIGTQADPVTLQAFTVTATQTGNGDIWLQDEMIVPTVVDLSVATGATGDINFTYSGLLLLVDTVSTDGNVTVVSGSDMLLGTITGNDVSLTSTLGSIDDANLSDPNVAATNLTMVAATGMCEFSDPLELQVTSLNATVSGDGELFMANAATAPTDITLSLAGIGDLSFSQSGAGADLLVTDVSAADGDLTLVNEASIQLASVSAPQGAVTITSSAGALDEADPTDPDADVTGLSATFSAATGIGETSFFDTDAATITANTATNGIFLNSVGEQATTVSATVASFEGDIEIFQDSPTPQDLTVATATTPLGIVVAHNESGGNLTVASVQGFLVDLATHLTGDVNLGLAVANFQLTVDSAGAVLDANGADPNAQAETIDLIATTRVGDTLDPLEVDAFNTITHLGDVLNTESYGSAVGDGIFVDLGAADFQVLAASSDGTEVSILGSGADALTFQAGVVNGSNAAGLLAYRNTSLTSPDISVGSLSAQSVVLATENGVLTDSNGAAANITAQSVDLTALNGIGNGGDALELVDAEFVDAVTDTGDLRLYNDSALATDAWLEVLSAAVPGTIVFRQTGTGTLNGELVYNNLGDIVLRSQRGGLVLTQVTAEAGSILGTTVHQGSIEVESALASGDITLSSAFRINDATGDPDVDLEAATMTLTAARSIGQGDPLDIDATGAVTATVTGPGMLALIDRAGGLEITSASTSQGVVRLSAANGDLTAHSVSAGGSNNLWLSTFGTGDVLAGSVSAPGASLSVRSAGSVQDLDLDAGADLTAQRLRLDTQTGAALDVDVDILRYAGVAQTGALDLADTAGGMRLLYGVTTDGAVTLEAQGGNLEVDSAVVRGAGRDFTGTTTGSGDLIVGSIVASGDTIVLDSAGAILEQGADDQADLAAADLTLLAQSGIGEAGVPIETDVARLQAGVAGTGRIAVADDDHLEVDSAITSDGSIWFRAGGLLTLNQVAAGGTGGVVGLTPKLGNILVDDVSAGGTIGLTAFGSVEQTDADLGPELTTPGSIVVITRTGVGTLAPLEIEATTLTAETTISGDISVLHTGAAGSTLRLSEVATALGDVDIRTAGATLRADTVFAQGDVTLTTSTDGHVLVDMVEASGSVTLDAARSVNQIGPDPDVDIAAGTASSILANGGFISTTLPLQVDIMAGTLSVLATGQVGGTSIRLEGMVNGSPSPTGNLIKLAPTPGQSLFNGISF